jgi:HD-GYP domain-containing protein (c-di-GMP phosphodiesterase class II)
LPIQNDIGLKIIYMNDSAAVPISLSQVNLQTIPVEDIRLGMRVHAIAEQAGKLSVKNKGEVKHLDIINKLAASGVKTIVIDNSPVNNGKGVAIIHAKHKNDHQRKLRVSDVNRLTQKDIVRREEATQLLSKSEDIYNNFEKKIEKNINLDISETKELVSEVYHNLAKDPDALLCVSMLMNSSDYLANHSIHVATLMCYFAQKLDMSKKECEQLTLVGYLFDIGMIRVAENIRSKRGPLNEQELLDVQSHVQHSLDILAPLNLDPECLLAIEQHHERLDGSGYPNAYVGSEIHKFSRILSIVDSYDALTSMRAHQKPIPSARAMKILSNPKYGYDQKLVLQFIRIMGIYPVGSLVMLSNQCIAMVTKTIKDALITPEVNMFYSISENRYLPPQKMSLEPAKQPKTTAKSLHIIRPVLASEFGLDIEKIAT